LYTSVSRPASAAGSAAHPRTASSPLNIAPQLHRQNLAVITPFILTFDARRELLFQKRSARIV
jgi:hypothetical protein